VKYVLDSICAVIGEKYLYDHFALEFEGEGGSEFYESFGPRYYYRWQRDKVYPVASTTWAGIVLEFDDFLLEDEWGRADQRMLKEKEKVRSGIMSTSSPDLFNQRGPQLILRLPWDHSGSHEHKSYHPFVDIYSLNIDRMMEVCFRNVDLPSLGAGIREFSSLDKWVGEQLMMVR